MIPSIPIDPIKTIFHPSLSHACKCIIHRIFKRPYSLPIILDDRHYMCSGRYISKASDPPCIHYVWIAWGFPSIELKQDESNCMSFFTVFDSARVRVFLICALVYCGCILSKNTDLGTDKTPIWTQQLVLKHRSKSRINFKYLLRNRTHSNPFSCGWRSHHNKCLLYCC